MIAKKWLTQVLQVNRASAEGVCSTDAVVQVIVNINFMYVRLDKQSSSCCTADLY